MPEAIACYQVIVSLRLNRTGKTAHQTKSFDHILVARPDIYENQHCNSPSR